MTLAAQQAIPDGPLAVVVHQDAATSPTTIIDLLRIAVERNIPVEALERLQALHERVSERAAASEFAAALAAFQAACPPIRKTSTAEIATKSGIKYRYTYAELDQIARTVGPLLHARGLSYTWDSSIKDKMLQCVCTLRHVNGHQITATFTCPTENSSAMSEPQKVGAALTFARRQSLMQVLGVSTAEPDTDAANPTPITADQAADLEALIQEVGADTARFLKFAKVQRLADILARDYDAMVAAVRAYPEQKRQRDVAKKGGAA